MGSVNEIYYTERVNEVIDDRKLEFSRTPNLPYYRLSIDGMVYIECLEHGHSIELIAYNDKIYTYVSRYLPVKLRGTECYSYLLCNYIRANLLNKIPHQKIEKVIQLFCEYTHNEYIERKLVYTIIDFMEFHMARGGIDTTLNSEPYGNFLVDEFVYSSLVVNDECYKVRLDTCITGVISLMRLDNQSVESLREDIRDIINLVTYIVSHSVS